VRALVHHLPIELSGSRGDDGRARHCWSSRSDGIASHGRFTSWRVDETYIHIRGKFSYLYRAVDKHGKTVDFLLRPDRGIAAAQAFFRKALSTSLPRWPCKITLDGHLQSHLALRLLRRENPRWKYVEVRGNQYLNNLIEQDHRAIKRRCSAMVGGDNSRSGAVDIRTSGHKIVDLYVHRRGFGN
jgi:transposase-like protein